MKIRYYYPLVFICITATVILNFLNLALIFCKKECSTTWNILDFFVVLLFTILVGIFTHHLYKFPIKRNLEYKQSIEDSPLKMWAHKHWWILCIGVACYICGIALPHITIDWSEFKLKLIIPAFIFRIGETILIGCFITFFSSYKTIVNGYRNELKDLLSFDVKYLEQRRDITKIWDNVSEIVCKTRFHNIATELLKIVKHNYLKTKDKIRSYDKYDKTITINWDSTDKKSIKVIDRAEFYILTETDKDIDFSQTNSICTANNNVHSELLLSCDGQEVRSIGSYRDETNKLECEAHLKLTGSFKYKILKIIERNYPVDGAECLVFRAKYITNSMSVKISHPEDMKVMMLDLGNIGHFKENIINDKTCEYQYNGLILPRQGYIIVISPKTTNN